MTPAALSILLINAKAASKNSTKASTLWILLWRV
jgi:hypothetical protein